MELCWLFDLVKLFFLSPVFIKVILKHFPIFNFVFFFKKMLSFVKHLMVEYHLLWIESV